jgi:sugar phosphate isomerase/epimerase
MLEMPANKGRTVRRKREWPLASADFTFPLLPHDKVLDLIAALGLDGVDIGLFEGRSHLWPSRELENIERSAGELRSKLNDRGLAPADVFLQLNPEFVPYAINQPDATRRQHARDMFQRTLEYASRLGSPHVTTLPGVFFADDESHGDSWQRSLEELAWRVEQARLYDLIFSVEAHVGSLAPNPQEAERLVHGVPGLTLTLDYTHFTRIGLSDAATEPLVAHASHFHVRGARKDRLQTSFKDNTIDYAGVLRAMRAAGYHGYLGIEYVWIDWEHCNESDNLSETILFRDFLCSQMRG